MGTISAERECFCQYGVYLEGMGWLSNDTAGLDYDPAGAYVTAKRVAKIDDTLTADERVQYLTRGSRVDTEGAGSGSSLFGNDRSDKTGTRGYVRAAFTDERIVVKIPQWTGSDERSIPYTNIVSADLDTGFVNKRISIQTAGPTYHIEVHEPGKGECREIIQFVRKQASKAQGTGEDSSADPTEQLQRLKSLYDDGVVTDAEYEDKRTKLLDEI